MNIRLAKTTKRHLLKPKKILTNGNEKVSLKKTEEIKIEDTPLVIPVGTAAESANETVSGRRKRKLCTYYPPSKKSHTADSLGTE